MNQATASTFKSAWWLPGPHLQTLWPYFFRPRLELLLETERLELSDGDFVDLAKTTKTNGPIVLLFHGLEGSIHSPYAKPMMSAIATLGWQAVFMHFRGCSGEHNRLARGYHSGDTGDIASLVDTMKHRFPHRPLAVLGYSLGGNALLKYLGEADRSDKIVAAAAVSVPYALDVGAKTLNKGFSKFYQRHLISRLRKRLCDKFSQQKSPINIDTIGQLNSFYTFDDKITAPLHHFNGADDYYTQSSSRQFLHKINVPTLLVHASNDPFMTTTGIPTKKELSDCITLDLSKHGGHVGFVAGRKPWHPVYWLEHRIPQFFQQHLA